MQRPLALAALILLLAGCATVTEEHKESGHARLPCRVRTADQPPLCQDPPPEAEFDAQDVRAGRLAAALPIPRRRDAAGVRCVSLVRR
ncbi:hypothetical protein, partial [Streptomyces chiangmaiensis]|uniref:hypothetical protein n=1 Tax=Streptomyces chiangmaiensis TaxID=766497 RepID=UPI0038B56330